MKCKVPFLIKFSWYIRVALNKKQYHLMYIMTYSDVNDLKTRHCVAGKSSKQNSKISMV